MRCGKIADKIYNEYKLTRNRVSTISKSFLLHLSLTEKQVVLYAHSMQKGVPTTYTWGWEIRQSGQVGWLPLAICTMYSN